MSKNLETLSLDELRQMWTQVWGRKPHMRIGRKMLEKSLEYKLQERAENVLICERKVQLAQLIKEYKRNASYIDKDILLKPGTRLMRIHEGKKHSVLVQVDGFEYQGKVYSSLSKIANNITGKHWNGWVFFGLKRTGAS